LVKDVLSEALVGGAVSVDESPRAVAGECYHFPIYREWARVYNNVLVEGGHDEDSNENFPIGKTSRHLRLSAIRRHWIKKIFFTR